MPSEVSSIRSVTTEAITATIHFSTASMGTSSQTSCSYTVASHEGIASQLNVSIYFYCNSTTCTEYFEDSLRLRQENSTLYAQILLIDCTVARIL